ncbi:hypothetical protein SEVIR_8G247500v4 [Setaria viridis]|uniref:Uncharacterized protein n=1 Tax=Setaria viridis TaxID=4556 RepID=A0A4U6TMV5_SETVI|nr:UPF0481 protein At3g47200-like [Setaria viridis]TKW02525.1 hypothetical protein SEVIR_8G247500v2 [Setaria viridis]
MEPDATWVPCDDFELAQYWSMTPDDFQLANWTEEEEPAAWAHGLAMDSTGAQLVEYAEAATPPSDLIENTAQDLEVDLHNMVLKIHTDPIHVFEKAAWEFKVDVDMMKMKIHRYPASIRALGELYTVPTTVAIGPYHHGRDHLKPVEKVKHVAAYHCIRESGRSVQEMYDAVVAAAGDARRLYDGGTVGDEGEFLPMMFFDACFLVQYMLTCTRAGLAQMDPALRSFFDANDNDVYRDITLLENQLPWRVVEAVMAFRPVPLVEFVASLRGCLQDRKVQDSDEERFALDDGYEPPHLLGLLRYYIVGRSASGKLPALPETDAISFSVSTIELAEIGVTLTANKATELIHMGIKKKGNLFAELSLAPLSLDDTRACLLVNMAALELCTTSSFQDADDEESAVCSYLLLLGMIVEREEDVHELRRTRLLQGGGGLTNKEALDFLASLHGLRLGSRYVRTMEEIENYKVKRKTRTKAHSFVYRNRKTMLAVFSAVTAVVGIVGTLKSLKIVH